MEMLRYLDSLGFSSGISSDRARRLSVSVWRQRRNALRGEWLSAYRRISEMVEYAASQGVFECDLGVFPVDSPDWVGLRFFLRRYPGYEFACLLFESLGEGSEEYRAVSRSPWGGSRDWFAGSVILRW